MADDQAKISSLMANAGNHIYTDLQQRHIYEAILSNTPDFVYVIGTDHRFAYANRALLQMFGKTEGETIGKNFTELGYPPWHAERHDREIDEVIATKACVRGEVPFTGTNGPRVYDYIFSPILDEADNVTAIAGTTRDVTERKNIEDELRRSEDHRKLMLKAESDARQHLSMMLDSAEDYAIISTDVTGKIVSWNKGAKEIFHYQEDEAKGQFIGIIFTPEDRTHGVAAYELSAAATSGRTHDERWHMKKDGSRFYASGMMTAMRTEDGELCGFVKIARDMTYEKQIQEELIAARNEAQAANLAKSDFLANMSHEMRTPMNAVIGLSNIIATSQPLTEKQQQYISTLRTSAQSLLSLINDLLDISKIEATTVELEQIPFSVAQLVDEVIDAIKVRAESKGLTLSSSGACECINKRMFVGDPTRLRQILLNLCSNAVKFTEQGSVHIDIRCEKLEDPKKEQIFIVVKDTGVGIASDKLSVIFQKFVQADSSINRKYGGTGLGLAITRALAKVMGGTIEVESELGSGSTFTVSLPLQIAESIDIARSDGTLEHIVDTSVTVDIKPRILLVEDYAPNVLVATTFLEQFGYLHDVAANGLEAIEKIKAGDYAAILMDVQMPGMNGFQATQLIRAAEKLHDKPRIPIIGMTAHALVGDRERCMTAGMDDYIAKPFKPNELRDKLQAILASKS